MRNLRHGGRPIKVALVGCLLLLAGILLGGSGGTYKGARYAGGPGTYRNTGGQSWTGGVYTVAMAPDTAQTGHTSAYFDSLMYGAEKADRLYQIDDAGVGFCYAFIDSAHTGETYWVTDNENHIRAELYGTATDWVLNDDTVTRPMLTYFDPFGMGIPRGAQIVSASLNFYWASWAYDDPRDSVVSVLMTLEDDNAWYTSKQVYDQTEWQYSTDRSAYMSHASWSYQIFGSGTHGYPASSSDPWVPALSERETYLDWADTAAVYSDWCSPVQGLGSPYTGMGAIDITNCVQAIVNGATNNGIMTFLREYATQNQTWLANWDVRSDYYHLRPWLEIKYLDAAYVAPFPGGADIAFVFSTDDGKSAFNDSVAAIWNGEVGGTFSSYMAEKHIAASGGGASYSAAEWMDLYEAGNEIGPHSRYHDDTHGLAHWTHEMVMPDVYGAVFDSLKFDMNNVWMYEIMVDAGEDTTGLRSSGRFGATMALPLNVWTPEVLLAGMNLGYTAIRTGALRGMTDTVIDDYFEEADYRPSATDTLYAGQTQYRRRDAYNMNGLPTTMPIYTIVGLKAESPSVDETYHRMKWAIHQIRGQGRGVIHFYDHDFKSGGYADGVDPDQMRGMTQAASNAGAWITGVGSYVSWMKSFSDPVQSTVGAQPDTFQTTAEDDAWYRPQGIDNRFIRGYQD